MTSSIEIRDTRPRKAGIDWRNERFVYGTVSVCVAAVLIVVLLGAAFVMTAPKITCALQSVSNEFCLKISP